MSEIPRRINAHQLRAQDWPQTGIVWRDGRTIWVAARPYPFFSVTERWRLAWSVLWGHADALFWEIPHDV